MPISLRVAVFTAVVFLCSSVALAQQDHHTMVANVPATHVRILGTLFAESGSTYYQCVAFVNDGETAITAATFKLIYFDQTKHDAGTQEIEVRAPLAPHSRFVPAGFGQGDDPAQLPNCKPLAGSQKIIDMTFIAPEHVEYSDGSTWDLKKRPESPSPSPSPQ